MSAQCFENLRQQFQKAAGSLSNFHKTATHLERQAYYQGQYDILNMILQISNNQEAIIWIKKKRDDVLNTMEKLSYLLKIPKSPLIFPEIQNKNINRNSLVEEPQIQQSQICAQIQYQLQQQQSRLLQQKQQYQNEQQNKYQNQQQQSKPKVHDEQLQDLIDVESDWTISNIQHNRQIHDNNLYFKG